MHFNVVTCASVYIDECTVRIYRCSRISCYDPHRLQVLGLIFVSIGENRFKLKSKFIDCIRSDQPVVGFTQRRPGFEPGSGHVGFVVYKVAREQVFSEYFGFPC
jgi:hypothetical protein